MTTHVGTWQCGPATPHRTPSDALAARVAACSHTASRRFDGAAYYGDDDGWAPVALVFETCPCSSTLCTDLQHVLHDDSR